MQSDSARSGLVAGVTTYLLWGLMPLYWKLVSFASPLEILGQRIIWSFVLVTVVLLTLRTPWRTLARTVLTREHGPRLLAAAGLITVNWLVYIVAVNSGHVVESALGYFINPLVNVLLGVWIFREPFNRGGRIGAAVALLGVCVIAAGKWQTLWISLLLATSFGLYGVVKKKLPLPAADGLFVESAILLPCALAYCGFLGATGGAAFGRDAGHSILLMLLGPATFVPLWLFAVAARRLPLGVIGVLQYLAPTIQFLMGITLFGEHVSPAYWAGLVAVWLGSGIYLSSTLREHRQGASSP